MTDNNNGLDLPDSGLIARLEALKEDRDRAAG